MKNGLIREALRIAREKLPLHPQFAHWPHYCFIIQSNQIVDWGYNTSDEPPIHLGYHAQLGGAWAKTHAEVNAFRAAKGLLNPSKPFESINIRLSRQGHIRESAPCPCCSAFLKNFGCTQCWFTVDIGFAKIRL
jgi:tRNA(Arg) A34 adenosine deaminase TadA